jgi:hypothetical protein
MTAPYLCTTLSARKSVSIWLERVVIRLEGNRVLKSMFLMKLKTMTAPLLVAAVIAIPATGLAYRVMAGEKENQTQRQEVQSDQPCQGLPLKDQKAPEQPDKVVLLKRH